MNILRADDPQLWVDVFSLKGGVGKTTLSYLLACAIAEGDGAGRPALLLDADLLGTCLGDHFLPLADSDWSARPNLAHLLTLAPEALPELLGDGSLPVYLAGAGTPVKGGVQRGAVLLCPSHAWSGAAGPFPAADPVLIGALAAHETAGRWVEHVLCLLARATARVIGLGEGGFSAVIVDHGPGMAAVQRRAVERARERGCGRGPSPGRLLLVVGPDLVDQLSARTFLERDTDPQDWLVLRNRGRKSPGEVELKDTCGGIVAVPTQEALLHGVGAVPRLDTVGEPVADAIRALAKRLVSP